MVFKIICASRIHLAGIIASTSLKKLFQGEEIDAIRTEKPNIPSFKTNNSYQNVADLLVQLEDDDDPLCGYARYSVEDSSLVNTQLQSIAAIGRLNAQESLVMLTEGVKKKVAKVLHQRKGATQHTNLVIPNVMVVRESEELRWMLMLLGFILADDCEGEAPLIPGASR